ncbi:MAG: SDR family NAD(P)-dependent oxidoreductase, partial [Sphingomonadaceae bacterium]
MSGFRISICSGIGLSFRHEVRKLGKRVGSTHSAKGKKMKSGSRPALQSRVAPFHIVPLGLAKSHLREPDMKIDSNVAAVVTGGASGLGEATARALAEKGVKVAVLDRGAGNGNAVGYVIGGGVCGGARAGGAAARGGVGK